MTEARVRYDPGKPPLKIRFDGQYPNFTLDADRLRTRALAEIDPLCDDFLEIASTVFVADGTVSRGGDVRAQMGQDWRRDFSFTIPVRKPEFWQRPAVVEALISMARSRCGFSRKREHPPKGQRPSRLTAASSCKDCATGRQRPRTVHARSMSCLARLLRERLDALRTSEARASFLSIWMMATSLKNGRIWSITLVGRPWRSRRADARRMARRNSTCTGA